MKHIQKFNEHVNIDPFDHNDWEEEQEEQEDFSEDFVHNEDFLKFLRDNNILYKFIEDYKNLIPLKEYLYGNNKQNYIVNAFDHNDKNDFFWPEYHYKWLKIIFKK